MISYIIIVIIGVMAFTNTFLAVRQVIYIRMANSTEDGAPSRPFKREMEVTDWWSFKDKWMGEYISIWQEVFVGAVIGLEGDNAVGFSDTQWLLFLVAIIFNTIILMNLLLAIVGFVQGDIQEVKEEYYFQQLVYQMCMLQRLPFIGSKKDRNKKMLFMSKIRRELEASSTEASCENESSEMTDTLDLLKNSLK